MRHSNRFLLIMPVIGFLFLCIAPVFAQEFPRIANLWGGGVTGTDYPAWARYDLVVFAGGSPTQWQTFSDNVRKLNPDIIILNTGPLMNLGAPEATSWMKPEWYIRRPDGNYMKWWADMIYTPNLFNDDCLNALVEQTVNESGEMLRAGTANGMFYDSVVGNLSWFGPIDLDGDGQADNTSELDALWLERQNLFFDKVNAQFPSSFIMANDLSIEHMPHVNGRLFEGVPLLDKIIPNYITPTDAIRTLNNYMTTSQQPAITFALATHPLGWQGWRVGKGNMVTTKGEVDRIRRDFRRMRLGLCTTLMTDAYYAYDFGTVWYGLPLWYAEYDAPLGKALGQAREVNEVPPVEVVNWQAGDAPDIFKLDGVTKSTPEGILTDLPDEIRGWQRVFGTDAEVVKLLPGKAYHIQAKLQIIRNPQMVLQFNVRTPTGGWEHHDKGVTPFPAGQDEWIIDTTVVPDDFYDYSAEWHMNTGGAVVLKSLKVELVDQSYWIREFEGGAVLVNPLPLPIEVNLSKPMKRIQDSEAPRYVIELDDSGIDFTCTGAWEMKAGETGFMGSGYHVARKPGESATYKFTAPATDSYKILTAVPAKKDLTTSAAWSVKIPPLDVSATMNQSKADGNWTELFTIPLKAGEACEVMLNSSGDGPTAIDALRVESQTRYNDGALVETISLDPLDGIILVNP